MKPRKVHGGYENTGVLQLPLIMLGTTLVAMILSMSAGTALGGFEEDPAAAAAITDEYAKLTKFLAVVGMLSSTVLFSVAMFGSTMKARLG